MDKDEREESARQILDRIRKILQLYGSMFSAEIIHKDDGFDVHIKINKTPKKK